MFSYSSNIVRDMAEKTSEEGNATATSQTVSTVMAVCRYYKMVTFTQDHVLGIFLTELLVWCRHKKLQHRLAEREQESCSSVAVVRWFLREGEHKIKCLPERPSCVSSNTD